MVIVTIMSSVAIPYELESRCHDTINKHALKESFPEFVRTAAQQRIDRLNGGQIDDERL